MSRASKSTLQMASSCSNSVLEPIAAADGFSSFFFSSLTLTSLPSWPFLSSFRSLLSLLSLLSVADLGIGVTDSPGDVVELVRVGRPVVLLTLAAVRAISSATTS